MMLRRFGIVGMLAAVLAAPAWGRQVEITGFDCADPGCATSSACTTCSPLGASCTQNGQCCSQSCSGKPNRKTCK